MSVISIARYAAALLLASAPITYAQAQTNCELQLVGGTPLEFDETGRPMVPATIEGRNKYVMIDTGGFTNTLDLATARELDLRLRNSRISIMAVTGESSSQSVTLSEYRIGNMNLDGHEVMISPFGDGVVSDTQPVGTLVSGVFQTFDMELNYNANRMLLYSQNHCDGAFAQNLPAGTEIAVIPFTLNESFHLVFPVTIDGVEFDAILDTGAANTTLSLPAAEQHLAVDRSSPELEEVGTLDGRYSAAVYAKQFESIEIGGLVIPDPELVLLPDMMSRYQYTSMGFEAPDNPSLPDVILGMNILRHFHTYIAFGEKNLYLALDFASVARPPSAESENTGQTAPNAQRNEALISAINRSLLDEILADEGYTIASELDDTIIAVNPDKPLLFLWLVNCGADGMCTHLRLRGTVPIGDRAEARIGAADFDRAVPMAFVAVLGSDADSTVFVGRDLWMEPGHTRENIIAEIQHTVSLTAQLAEHLGAQYEAP